MVFCQPVLIHLKCQLEYKKVILFQIFLELHRRCCCRRRCRCYRFCCRHCCCCHRRRVVVVVFVTMVVAVVVIVIGDLTKQGQGHLRRKKNSYVRLPPTSKEPFQGFG